MPRTDALLLIRLYADNQLGWWLRDVHGKVTTGEQLSELPVVNPATHIILIVPGGDVLLTQVDLPDLPAARLVKALPFALEEQLASPIETLQFAYGTRGRSEPLPVAVVTRNVLDDWLTRLGEAGIMADMIVADCLCVPWEVDSWSIALERGLAMVRLGRDSGFTIEAAALSMLIRTSIEAAGERVPKVIRVLRYDDTAVDLSVLADLGLSVEDGTTTQTFMAAAATTLVQAPPINLLQGEYQPVHRTVRLRRQWRWARNLAIAWVIVFVLSHIGQLVYLRIASDRLTKQINAMYQRDFPEASAVVEPKVRIGRELKELTAAAEGSDFLRVLTLAGNEIHSAKDIKLLSLSFQDERLTIDIEAPNFNALNQLEQKIREQGLVVNQQSASTKAKVVEAQLDITQPR